MATVQISEAEIPFMKALLDGGTVYLQQSQSLLRNPMFAPGARLVVDEMKPALEWLRLTIKQAQATGGEG